MKIQQKAVKTLLNYLKALVIPVGMWLLFAILTKGRTASKRMLMNTLRQGVSSCIICYGLLMNFKLGMLNFSAGALMLFAGIVGGNLAKITGTGIPGLCVFVMLIAIVLGLATGLMYNFLRVPCLVLSLGLMLVWEAAPKLFFGAGLNLKSRMTILARSPACFWVLGICAVLFFVLYNLTAYGHNLRAMGSNQSIATSVGLNGDKIKLLSFVIGAIFLGVASVLYVSERGETRNVATMDSLGIMMDGFMSMFIALFLSKYCDLSVAVILGTFSMKMLSNGFVAMGLSSTMRDITQGVFLLVLLAISANAGVLDRKRQDRAFAKQCQSCINKGV